MKPLESLPPDSRVWIFSLTQPVDAETASMLTQRLDEFTGAWKSHGDKVTGAAELVERKFIVVAADIRWVQVSGCSIDSLTRSLKNITKDLGLSLSGLTNVFFRENGEIREMDRVEFGEYVRSGAIGADTKVFDTSIQTLEQYTRGDWQRAFASSWHARAFPLPETRCS